MKLVKSGTILLALAICQFSSAAEQAVFERDVRPILVKHCIVCHGPGKQESNYRIDRIASLRRAGDSELQPVVPRKALASYLYQRISTDDASLRMPPKGEGLSDEEVNIVRTWIDSGAQASLTGITNATTDHWSFQKLQKPAPPMPGNASQIVNEVDQFIQSQLEARNLSLSPAADRHTLIRRLYLVMLGLQPKPEEIDRFVTDKAPDAYRRLVDRVLDSPHYGERWAQHWLDCVRYAESTGYEINRGISNIYPYRDYVIQALNNDLPYDQFIREQIAGDHFQKDAATGFLVAGPHDTNPSPDPRLTAMQFQDGHDEIIKTVSAVTMGLTLGCARCHDHKFDPLSQQDYYRMQAVFAGLSYGTRAQQGDEFDRMKQQASALEPMLHQLRQQADELKAQNNLNDPIDLREYDDTFSPVTTQKIKFLINRTNDGAAPELDDVEIWTVATPDQPSVNVAHRDQGATAISSPTAKGNQGKSADLLLDGSRQLLLYFKAADTTDVWFEIHFDQPYKIDRITIKPRGRAVPADYQIQYATNDDQWTTIVDSRNRYPHVTDTRTAETLILNDVPDDQRKTIAENTRKIRELTQKQETLKRGPHIFAGQLHSPRTTFLMQGGDPQKPGKQIDPGFISALGTLDISADTPEAERRLQLANAIASPENPLTARVITNRIWQHYFGTGIVDTPSDFGVSGGFPSHPELLDWLADYLVSHDWSLKELHRLLLSSHTFRQASHTNEAAFAIDSQTRLLWRFPPRRLEAEVLRDTILRASGKLNPQQFGEPFKFFEEATSPFTQRIPLKEFDEQGWRRMIYGEKIRLTHVGIFGVFDCPDASQMTPKRSSSTTAVQALALFNSHFVNRQAGFLAASIAAQKPTTMDQQIRTAFLCTISRPPTDSELQSLRAFVEQNGMSALCRILFNLNEFVFLN